MPDFDQASGDMVFEEKAIDTAEIPDIEELAKELYLALSEQETEDSMEFTQADLGSLPSWTKRMLDKLEEFLERSKSNIPIDALFISPADLAYKSTNLDTVGRLNISRIM